MHLQDWLAHPNVNLAAYFPFFRQAGVEKVQVGLLMPANAHVNSVVLLVLCGRVIQITCIL